MDANLAERQKALEEFKEKLKAMNLTSEQAAQILESMNAAELRYIQQNRKKRPLSDPSGEFLTGKPKSEIFYQKKPK